MRLLLLSVNHRTAPVELRERLALATADSAATLADLRARFGDCECVVVSTCNRLEIYVARPSHAPPTAQDLRQFLADRSGTPVETVTAASIQREGEPAVQHLFRVSTGLDSMVLGEPQVLGQVKRAYEAAAASGAVGPVLHRVFQSSVAAAKRLRSETGIGAGRMSIASVAVDFARRVFDNFADKTVVGIGAGEMAKVTLRHLLDLNLGRLWVVNRSVERAAALADQLRITSHTGGPRAWDDLDVLLVEADVILTSTASPEPILTVDRFKPLIRKRRNRPLLIVDITLPRDVEPGVGSLSNVYLYNLDDLQEVVQASVSTRRVEVDRCEAYIAQSAAACLRQVQSRDVGRLIRQLRHRLHDIGDIERERTIRKLESVGIDEAEAVLNEHTQRVINKILHLPLSQLDAQGDEAPLAFYAAALRRLFKLEEQDDHPPPPDGPAPLEDPAHPLH